MSSRRLAPAGGEGGILTGRRALVTGAASGIGLAIARHLAQHGMHVILADLPGDRLLAAAAELPGGQPIGADLSQRAEVERLGREAGEIDVLVNNAGLQHVSPVEDFPAEQWARMIDIMLVAPFLLTQALVPRMYQRGWGRIINIASVHGLIASPYKSAYVAAKHGLVGFTKAIALEAAEHSPEVTVHAICPSYVRTPLVERQIVDGSRQHGIPEEEVLETVLLARNATKRLIEPEQVAQAVAFLCGENSWAMNGAVFPLDAGWLAH